MIFNVKFIRLHFLIENNIDDKEEQKFPYISMHIFTSFVFPGVILEQV